MPSQRERPVRAFSRAFARASIAGMIDGPPQYVRVSREVSRRIRGARAASACASTRSAHTGSPGGELAGQQHLGRLGDHPFQRHFAGRPHTVGRREIVEASPTVSSSTSVPGPEARPLRCRSRRNRGWPGRGPAATMAARIRTTRASPRSEWPTRVADSPDLSQALLDRVRTVLSPGSLRVRQEGVQARPCDAAGQKPWSGRRATTSSAEPQVKGYRRAETAKASSAGPA